jgi:hypothetical protein
MKPCSRNRQLVTWLALDNLEIGQARELRAHLESCEGCRGYFEELSNVAERLATAAPGPDIQTSESFHQRVAGALRAGESTSAWETVEAYLRGVRLGWRMAVPAIAGAAVVIAALAAFVWRAGPSPQGLAGPQTVAGPEFKKELPPTLANYLMVADHSLEKLDDLLTRQGNRNPPSAQTYLAWTRVPPDAAD